MRVIVNGAHGKMGQLACKVVVATGNALVAELGRQDDLARSISECSAEVVIDVTSADSVYQNTKTILQNRARPIIGTSGLTEKQVAELAILAKEFSVGGLIAPNFSIGSVLMMRFAEQAARYFPQADIIEAHHRQKKDAPSGTAMRTAELIQAQQQHSLTPHHSVETMKGVLGAQMGSVSIHALRCNDIIANQQVIFSGLGETLTIEQRTLNRDAFSAGIQLALTKISTLEHLVFGLDKLL